MAICKSIASLLQSQFRLAWGKLIHQLGKARKRISPQLAELSLVKSLIDGFIHAATLKCCLRPFKQYRYEPRPRENAATLYAQWRATIVRLRSSQL